MADPRRAKSLRGRCDGQSTTLSDLSTDIICSIADRIDCFADYVCFDSVIQGLLPSASNSRRQLRMLRSFPWLVIDVDETTKILCFFTGRLFFPVRTPVPTTGNVTRCFGSSFGWLIMADTRYVEDVGSTSGRKGYLKSYLLNPCTDRRIQLPPFRGTENLYGKFMLSSSPPADGSSDGNVLPVMTDYYGFIGCCHLGDEEWSFRDRRAAVPCDDILFFKGVLYGVDDLGQIMTFDFVESERTLCERPFPLERNDKFNVGAHCQYNNFFLVDSGTELLLVVKDVEVCCRESTVAEHGPYCKCYDKAVLFAVFSLDFGGRRWVELTSLGDRMLLIDKSCSLSAGAAKFSSSLGLRPNCIYYTNHGDTDDYGWHEFCLEDHKIVPFGCNFSTLLPVLL